MAGFVARMDMNEHKHEKVNSKATEEENSSMTLVVALLVICSEVIKTRQNPKRLADADKICWDVFLIIS
jgi:hypothetical protein